jgi:hypothetical protein
MLELNGRAVVDYYIADVNTWDYPDFCDAYIADAVWDDTGEPLTDEESEQLNETYADVIGEMAYESLI